MKLEFSEYFF